MVKGKCRAENKKRPGQEMDRVKKGNQQWKGFKVSTSIHVGRLRKDLAVLALTVPSSQNVNSFHFFGLPSHSS
jgi:hypothetical protein